ncbi:MAG TPA: c-type cytochrome [Hyphomicrobium sp.]|nr:c-type cytochrome [Hyphomicrobium sp.]
MSEVIAMPLFGFAFGLVLSTVLTATAFAADGDTSGEQLFNNNCRTCHSWKEGDNRLGPSLHGIVGRKAGSISGYAFSPSMKQANITWDEATLDKFIASPDSVVTGNNMKPFNGISDAQTRQKIIEFLKSK